MIKCEQEGPHKYILYSSLHPKTAKVLNYGKVWQIIYTHNSARKNLSSYRECINYLVLKGW